MTTPFNVLLADPPWGYRNKKTGGSHTSGAAQKYPVMTAGEIGALDVSSILAPDAVCFLWATVPMLPEALNVLAQWGFDYKTSLTWHKTGRLGTGYWFRGEVELLLFGTRGKVRAFRTAYRNHIEAPVGEHSAKPEVFRYYIEQATVTMGERRFVEMFARREAKGWTSLGNAIDGKDIREALVA